MVRAEEEPGVKIKTRLMVSLLACGLLPMLAAGLVTLARHESNSRQQLAQATEALEQRAAQQLQAVSVTRRNDIVHYFESVEGVVRATAARRDVLDQVVALTDGITRLADGVDATQLATLRSELGAYWNGPFAANYAAENAGKRFDVQAALARLDAPAVMAQLLYVQRNPNPLGAKDALDDAGDGSAYSAAHASLHESLRRTQQEFGYYDLFVVGPNGRVVYSVFKELDYATSLQTGPWQDSGLGKLAQRLQDAAAGKVLASDYALYAPSYDGPASFVGTPLFDGDRRLGSVIVQLPIDRINAVASAVEGMGETGECVMVGPDLLMRSDSRHEPTTHSVVASFRQRATGTMDMPPVREALAGREGGGPVTDIDGGVELAHWLPIDVLGTRWAMVAKVETGEILASVATMRADAARAADEMLGWTVGLLAFVGIAVGAFSWWFAQRLVRPIQATADALHNIADGDGDLTARLDDSAGDEVGELARWFNAFLTKLRGSVQQVEQKANDVQTAADSLTVSANQLARSAENTRQQSSTVAAGAEQMNANMRTVDSSTDSMAETLRSVAAAVEQMTASIAEVAGAAKNAAEVAHTAADLTHSSHEKVSELGTAANEIGQVIETIQDIAEQTNLLALNATIEAARAGEAGKGFSVVANEVKDLARQTAESTQDIRNRIERIQNSTAESVHAIAAIDRVIKKVNESSRAIATSVGEQRAATNEISSTLAASTSRVAQVATAVRESSSASGDITRSIGRVDESARDTTQAADAALQLGHSMTTLARELRDVVGQFKTR
ncbi:MAG: methyl-accepting chemotaxis protein [Planctomycetes bacterium]|nr:methyl-accepting chemotaxis protein [Planctomycetota bacterium]